MFLPALERPLAEDFDEPAPDQLMAACGLPVAAGAGP